MDHKPLLRTLGDRCLNDIPNGRLRNLKEKTLRYRFRIIHTPGIRNKVPDALSRYPSGPRHPDTMVLEDDILDSEEAESSHIMEDDMESMEEVKSSRQPEFL